MVPVGCASSRSEDIFVFYLLTAEYLADVVTDHGGQVSAVHHHIRPASHHTALSLYRYDDVLYYGIIFINTRRLARRKQAPGRSKDQGSMVCPPPNFLNVWQVTRSVTSPSLVVVFCHTLLRDTLNKSCQ
jgi:hypothetical protein